MTAELRAYNPSWKDRLASALLGDSKAGSEWGRFVESTVGSTGLGNSKIGLLDLTPAGMAFSGNDAVRSAQNGHYGEAALNALGAVPAGVVTAGLSKGSQAVKVPFQSLMKQFQEAEDIVKSSSSWHNPPAKTQRHISQDYPNGVPVDATGRITRDIEGRELTAPIIVGWNDIRGAAGGTEIPLLPSQFATVTERSIGTRPTGVAGSTLGRKENGAYVVRRGPDGLERDIYYRDSLSPEEANKTISHEIGHMIDDLVGNRIGQKDGIPINAIPLTGVKKDAGRVYNDTHTDPSDWRLKRQEETGEIMPSKYQETPESIGYPKNEVDSELMANAIAVYATAPNYIKTVAPKLAARVREYVNSHPTLKHIIQFNSIAAAGGAGAAAMMPDDAKAAPMFDLLTNFMDRPVTQNRLLAPFLTGQGQQFSPRPNPNMLLQGAEAAQQPAPPLSTPTEVLRKQVAEVPRAVDSMPTNSTSQAMPSQPPQSKSGGFFDGLSKFGESDFGQRLGDMMLGWGMGGTMQDSLSKGSQMIAAGNQDRKAKKEQFSTAEWLKKQGMDEEEAKYVAGNSQALNAYLIALRKGVDPMQALQQRKMELEINKLENPQLSPSDQLAREKFAWEKNNGGGTTEYGLAPQYGTDESGNPVIMEPGKNGSAIKTPLLDPITHQQIDVIPKNNAAAADATANGTAKSEAKVALGGIEQNANQILSTIQSLEDDPKLDSMPGPVSSHMWNISGGANRVQSKMDQINGQAFLQALNSLRGSGAITDAEGAKTTQAFARLNAAQNPKDYREALVELRGIVQTGVARARSAVNGSNTQSGTHDPFGLR